MDGWLNMNFINPSGRFPQEIALPAAANANNFINVQKYKMLKIYIQGRNTQEEYYARQYLHQGVIKQCIEEHLGRHSHFG